MEKMRDKKGNCNQAKKYKIEDYFNKKGYPTKSKSKVYGMFLAFWRGERTESVKVDYRANRFIDFGSGAYGDIINLIQIVENCTVSQALEILNNQSFSFHQPAKIINPINEKSYSITRVTELTNPKLINYLKSRKIDIELAKKYCFQVHYKFKDYNEFYGIGFMNDFGGFEIRNSIYKICLYKKAITTINNNSDTVCLFESFSDFLSYLTLNKNNSNNENYIILNSTSLVKKAIELIVDFKIVKCFFDNDDTGKNTTQIIKENCNNEFRDESILYKNYNDFNEYLICIKSK